MCREWDSNPHGRSPGDFKSPASASSAIPAWNEPILLQSVAGTRPAPTGLDVDLCPSESPTLARNRRPERCETGELTVGPAQSKPP